ncbi:amidohydrolase family protein [Lentilactobacillus buchneri]|uniref:Amidohydrolase-related domain-containing protein n=1 Tax=Lentilactobacillus buchneri DSM 20057 TaxID=1423728 RepID=A0A4R5NHI5_LENBU|nr:MULTISPECIES: amidohydrolase family protein [Lentilactobacillus]WCJ52792.1 amidohydrolase family protein [Lentilactobacillus sp. Egmn17]AEB72344.1 o-pyrocatechuate decarboxylase [Lentilactobacillus buchneri NRRL B-30929]KRK69451.1 o-pyrocatechuate decarboxylase [Lentilactobacillus buchneri DSM 20057]MCT2882041.1 amidohydrolase [Lentilactobacillus buchneri]MCT3252721.1 amidohydrolase [Lentilactobacillus buchneri]
MKVITLEEHFSSQKLGQKMAEVLPKRPIGNVSPKMQDYMQRSLPPEAELEDVTGSRIQWMDQHQISMQILSYGNQNPQNSDPKFAVELTKLANDELAKAVAKAPDRFRAFASLPVSHPTDAAAELKRGVEELGFKGAMLVRPTSQAHPFFDDPFYLPIFEAAANLNVPVYLHPSFPDSQIIDYYYSNGPWDDKVSGILGTAGYGWHTDVGIQTVRLLLSGVFEKYPNLKLISGHWGEFASFALERMDQVMYPETNLSEPISKIYRDHVYVTPSGILTEPQLKFVKDEVGIEHLLYSIDYPYIKPENSGSFIESSPLTDEEKELFAHGNAEKLLQL